MKFNTHFRSTFTRTCLRCRSPLKPDLTCSRPQCSNSAVSLQAAREEVRIAFDKMHSVVVMENAPKKKPYSKPGITETIQFPKSFVEHHKKATRQSSTVVAFDYKGFEILLNPVNGLWSLYVDPVFPRLIRTTRMRYAVWLIDQLDGGGEDTKDRLQRFGAQLTTYLSLNPEQEERDDETLAPTHRPMHRR